MVLESYQGFDANFQSLGQKDPKNSCQAVSAIPDNKNTWEMVYF